LGFVSTLPIIDTLNKSTFREMKLIEDIRSKIKPFFTE
jgi:hypothetical protein